MSLRSGFNYEKALETRHRSSPARGYLWHVVLPDLLEHPSDTSKSSSFQKAKQQWESSGEERKIEMKILNTLVTDITTPYFTIESDKVVDGSTFWYKPKQNDIGNISITFEEQEGGIVYRYLNNIKDLIINPDGNYNPPHFFKRDFKFYLLNTAKEEFQLFTFRNYFITEVSARSNTYTSNEPIQYIATFTGDSLEPPKTVSGESLKKIMQEVSDEMNSVRIPYDRFNFSGVPTPAIAGLLDNIARRAF